MSDKKNRIREQVKEHDIKFIKLQFVDLFGELKNISITSGQLAKALDGSFMVDGFYIRAVMRKRGGTLQKRGGTKGGGAR